MTKYFVDVNGRYLGGFDGAEPPVSGIEVPTAPNHAADTWNGSSWVPFVRVPQSVSPLQIRIALRKQGLRDALDAAVAQGTPDEQDAWEFATEIRRDNGLVAKFAQALGKTDADVDALFILADTI